MAMTDDHIEVRMGWGLPGLEYELPWADVIVIVDSISFSTAVDIATSRGAYVYPFRYSLEEAGQLDVTPTKGPPKGTKDARQLGQQVLYTRQFSSAPRGVDVDAQSQWVVEQNPIAQIPPASHACSEAQHQNHLAPPALSWTGKHTDGQGCHW